MLFFHLRHGFGDFASHTAGYGIPINDLGSHRSSLPFSNKYLLLSGPIISPASVASSSALMLRRIVIRYEPNTSRLSRPVTGGTIAALFVNDFRQLFYKTAPP
jgi:hypothetical protein